MDTTINLINKCAESLYEEAVSIRRDLHHYPETAFLEMRTTVIISRYLKELGYEVLTGKEVCLEGARLGVPDESILKEHADKVLMQGISVEELSDDIKEGYTGVIGILHCGEGPVTVLRFDIDALGLNESKDTSHRPYAEGFASCNQGIMHGCGHDAHTAIGLCTAKILKKIQSELRGTVKIIFQPGEEGGHGAAAVTAHGHLDDADYFIGNHIAPSGFLDDGDLTPGTYGSLANTKYDVVFHGKASHAGGYPENGRNALTAAAQAILGLYAIPRHSAGTTRVNVGTIKAGTSRNVIPDEAFMEMEVRGETTEINRYMEEQAAQVINGAAMMHGCTCAMTITGRGETQYSDESLWSHIADLISKEQSDLSISSIPNAQNWGSEDISIMMNRVQEHGGKAVYMRTMTPMAGAQHTVGFDFDETVLTKAVRVFSTIVYDLNGDR